jgi:hypothetical protein
MTTREMEVMKRRRKRVVLRECALSTEEMLARWRRRRKITRTGVGFSEVEWRGRGARLTGVVEVDHYEDEGPDVDGEEGGPAVVIDI